MKYEIKLNDNKIMYVDVDEFDIQDFTDKLNNRELIYVNVGDIVFNKHVFNSCNPVNEQ